VSKGSVSLWCQEIILTKKQAALLKKKQVDAGNVGRILGAKMNKQKRLDAIESRADEGNKRIGSLSQRDLLMLGVGLYWGEGVKSRNGTASLVNSDPTVLLIGKKWFQECLDVPLVDFNPYISISEIHKNREEKIGLYNHLGMIHRELRNYDDALFYYDKSLHLVKNSKDSSTVFNNKGIVYKYQNKYNLAIEVFKKAHQINWRIDDSLNSARTLSNLGFSESKLNRKTALPRMLKALSIRKELGRDEYPSYNHLSQYYLDRFDTINALKYAKKGYKVAEKINSPVYREDALSNLVNLRPYTYFHEYKTLADSITKVKQLQENKYASAKYNFHKQQEIANKNKLDKEQEQKLKILWQIILVLIILLFITIYIMNKSRYKKGKVEEVIKTEERISKKVHDVVANDLYQAMTKLQSNTNSKEDILDDLENVYDKARDISRENTLIDDNEDFGELIKDLLLSYKSKSVNVITKNISSINWNKASYVKKTTVYRVLQELMTNMKKHSKASIVVLTFNQKNKLIISYGDNGIGSIIKKHGGLQNAENRIKSINGKIIFESKPEEGFKVKITI